MELHIYISYCFHPEFGVRVCFCLRDGQNQTEVAIAQQTPNIFTLCINKLPQEKPGNRLVVLTPNVGISHS